jgi:sugar phosphate permease
MMAYGGSQDVQSHAYFYFVFIIMGFSQAFVYPINVSTVGSWFTKSSRGLIGGFYGTSSNIGNIIGIQGAAAIFRVIPEKEWYMLFVGMIVLCIITIIVVMLYYKPYPDLQEIIID